MLDSFHPAVRTWFGRRFPGGPTEPQVGRVAGGGGGQAHADRGAHRSGKTLAAFLVCIDRLYQGGSGGRAASQGGGGRVPPVEAGGSPGGSAPRGPAVVYVSPLKALATDIQQNLEAPLREIAAVAGELGLAAPEDPGGGQDRRHGRRGTRPPC